jgi:multidrug efflux pump subunit AcrB
MPLVAERETMAPLAEPTSAMLVPAVSIPVTIVGSFAAMAALGFTVNLMTLFALILILEKSESLTIR